MTKDMEFNELKDKWLGAFPDSAHPLDRKRFIRYAIALARADGSLDTDEMEQRGISSESIQEYRSQYEFLRDVLDVLDER